MTIFIALFALFLLFFCFLYLFWILWLVMTVGISGYSTFSSIPFAIPFCDGEARKLVGWDDVSSRSGDGGPGMCFVGWGLGRSRNAGLKKVFSSMSTNFYSPFLREGLGEREGLLKILQLQVIVISRESSRVIGGSITTLYCCHFFILFYFFIHRMRPV